MLGASALAAASCAAITARVTPEGNLAFGPRNAALSPPGTGRMNDAPEDRPPTRHIARSAFDRWRPEPLGVLPPDNLLRNTSQPVSIRAGELALTVRASDTLVPAWGGDLYLRVDLSAGSRAEQVPPRDLVVLVDTAERDVLPRARRLAAALFETLRAADRGALVTTAEYGRVLVPLLPSSAVPLLIERTHALEARGGEDLSAALARAVPQLGGEVPGRIRRLVVLSGSGALIDSEARQWVEIAQHSGAEVRLVPLSPDAQRRFDALAAATDSVALPIVARDDRHEREAIEELSALPPLRAVAEDVTLVVGSVPGPMHLIEVAGASPLWTPEGGEVPLGDVPAGDTRTVVLRASVPAWRAGEPYEISLRVRFRDARGLHEERQVLRARYSASPREYAASRAGDVLQYVSLLNTLSNVQAALARGDEDTLDSLRGPAELQARSLTVYAREHRDAIMFTQAELMLHFLAMDPALAAQIGRPGTAR